MIVELSKKSQITIPKTIVKSLNLKVGDKFEIYENNGAITMIPVVVYPKGYINDLLKEEDEVKSNIASGTQQIFDDVPSLLTALEED